MRKRFLRKYGSFFNKKIFGLVILSIFTGFVIVFVPPQNTVIILGFDALLATICYIIGSFFFKKSTLFVVALSVFLLLLLKSLSILDLLNGIILASFIVALTLFLHQK